MKFYNDLYNLMSGSKFAKQNFVISVYQPFTRVVILFIVTIREVVVYAVILSE